MVWSLLLSPCQSYASEEISTAWDFYVSLHTLNQCIRDHLDCVLLVKTILGVSHAGQIVEDFRNGNADVVLAARSVLTNSRWEILGSPVDVRIYKYAELLIKRGDLVVRYKSFRKKSTFNWSFHSGVSLPLPSSDQINRYSMFPHCWFGLVIL